VSVKAPKHKSSPTLPFSADEMKRILDVCDSRITATRRGGSLPAWCAELKRE
jgi:hypothetical protein